jgi:signal-transduction protein with cAMP-binding, CBS, and nucleotidyltransferase domain
MHLEKGDTLFQPGEPALSFYIVKSGRIDLLDQNGLVKSVGPGEHFGERALLSDHIWRFTAVAAEPSTLVSLDAKVFETISSASASIREFFSRSSSQYTTRQQVEAMVAGMPAKSRELKAQDLMSANLVTLSDTDTVATALKKFSEHAYHSLPLLDSSGKVLGVIGEDEILEVIKGGGTPQETALKDMRATQLPTVLPGTGVPEVVERFCRSGRHKLLVVDEAGKLHGVLTPIDLLRKRDIA